MKRFFQIFVLFNLVILFSGCSPVISWMYGIKSPEWVTENEIIKYSKKFKIPAIHNYELDTSYVTYLFSLDTAIYKSEIKNHYQPLQVLYFDNTGRLISYLVNCYAPGFPNLKWNYNGVFNTFPPGRQAPVDTLFSLDRQTRYLRSNYLSDNSSIRNFNYTIVVYWNKFMGRQTKRLIRYVQENTKLANKDSLRIIYANTDNIFAVHK